MQLSMATCHCSMAFILVAITSLVSAQNLSPTERKITSVIAAQNLANTSFLEQLISINSGTMNISSVHQVADMLASRFAIYEIAGCIDAFRQQLLQHGLTFNVAFVIAGTTATLDTQSVRTIFCNWSQAWILICILLSQTLPTNLTMPNNM
jgi:hypothetical protein